MNYGNVMPLDSKMETNVPNIRNGINQHNLINIIPRSDTLSEYVSDEEKHRKRERLLRLISELSINLDRIREEEKRPLCEYYRSVLQKLKKLLVSPKSSLETLKKCEEPLQTLLEKIDSSKINDRKKRPSIGSPDSTEVHIDLTSDEEKIATTYQPLTCYSPTGSVENQPDSTVTEDSLNIHCSERLDPYRLQASPDDADNEVSSSESISKPRKVTSVDNLRQKSQHIIDVDEILRDVQQKTGFTLKRSKNCDDFIPPKAHLESDSDRVQYILNLAKQAAVPKTTDNSATSAKVNGDCLSFDNVDHFSKSPPNEDLRERLSELMKAPTPALERLSDEVVNLFSRHSTNVEAVTNVEPTAPLIAETEDANDIDAWVKKAESVILNDSARPVYLTENLIRTGKSSASENPHNSSSRLSIILEKMIMPDELKMNRSSPTVIDENTSNQLGSVRPPTLKLPSPVLSPPQPNTTITKKTNPMPAGSLEIGRRSLISKLSQEIGVMHKVGDSHKITPSLKLLKTDLKKLTSSGSLSTNVPTVASECAQENADDDPGLLRDPRLQSVFLKDPRATHSPAIKTFTSKRIDPRLDCHVIGMLNQKSEEVGNRNSSPDADTEPLSFVSDDSSVPPSSSPSSASKSVSKCNRSYSSRKSSFSATSSSVDSRSLKPSVSLTSTCRSKDQSRIRPSTVDPRLDNTAQIKSNIRKPNHIPTLSRRRSSDLSNNKKNSNDLKKIIKEKSEFYSPLTGMYSEVRVPKTGIGYGYQKFKSSFKIPKIARGGKSTDRKLSEVLMSQSNKNSSSDAYTIDDLQPDGNEKKIDSARSQQQKQTSKSESEEVDLGVVSNRKQPCEKTESGPLAVDDKLNEESAVILESSTGTCVHQMPETKKVNNDTADQYSRVTKIKADGRKKKDAPEDRVRDLKGMEATKSKSRSPVTAHDGDVMNRDPRIANHRAKISERKENEDKKLGNTSPSPLMTCGTEEEIKIEKGREYSNQKTKIEKIRERKRKKNRSKMNLQSNVVDGSGQDVLENSASQCVELTLIRNGNNGEVKYTEGNSDIADTLVVERGLSVEEGPASRTNSWKDDLVTPVTDVLSDACKKTDRYWKNNEAPFSSLDGQLTNHLNVHDFKNGQSLPDQPPSSELGELEENVREGREESFKKSSKMEAPSAFEWFSAVDFCDEKCSCAFDLLQMLDENEREAEIMPLPLCETTTTSADRRTATATLLLSVSPSPTAVPISSPSAVPSATSLKLTSTPPTLQPSPLLPPSSSSVNCEDKAPFPELTTEVTLSSTVSFNDKTPRPGDKILPTHDMVEGEKLSSHVESCEEKVTSVAEGTPLTSVAIVSDILVGRDLAKKEEENNENNGTGACCSDDHKDASDDDDDLKILTRLKSIPSLKNALKDTDSKQKSWLSNLILSLDREKLEIVQAALKNKSAQPLEEDLQSKANEQVKGRRRADEKQAAIETVVSSDVHAKDKTYEPEGCAEENGVSAEVLPEGEKLVSLEVVLEKATIQSDAQNQWPNDAKKAPLSRSRGPGMRELDLLHADIRKMKRTKNNIFTAIGPRSCRKQPPIYTDRVPSKSDSTGTSSAACGAAATTTAANFVVANKSRRKSSVHSSSNESSSVDTEEEILTGHRYCSRKNKKKNRKLHSVTSTTTNTTASEDLSDDSSSSERFPSKAFKVQLTSNSEVENDERYSDDEDSDNDDADCEIKGARRGYKSRELRHRQKRRQKKRQREPKTLSLRAQRRLRRRQLRLQLEIEEQQRLADDNNDILVSNRPKGGEKEKEGKGKETLSAVSKNASMLTRYSVKTSRGAVYKPCPKREKLRRYGEKVFSQQHESLHDFAIVLTKLPSEGLVALDNGGNNDKGNASKRTNTKQITDGEMASDSEVMEAKVDIAGATRKTTCVTTTNISLSESSLPPPLPPPITSDVPIIPLRVNSPQPPPLSPHLPTQNSFEMGGEKRAKDLKKNKKKKKKREMRVKPLKLTRLNDVCDEKEPAAASLARWNLSSSQATAAAAATVTTSPSTVMTTTTTTMAALVKTTVTDTTDPMKKKKKKKSRQSNAQASIPKLNETDQSSGSVTRNVPVDDNAEEVAAESCLSERIARLPDRNVFLGDTSNVRIASILISVKHYREHPQPMSSSSLSYKCVTSTCDYDTDDVKMFASHLNFLHKNVTWDRVCCLCTLPCVNQISSSADLIDALEHVLREHSTSVADIGEDQQQTAQLPLDESPPLVTIKEEPPEKHSEIENVCSVELESEVIPEKGTHTDENMSPPKVATIVPRLRVRRFSGDLLSGNGDRNHSVELKSKHMVSETALNAFDWPNKEYTSETLSLVITEVRTLHENKMLNGNVETAISQSNGNQQRKSTSGKPGLKMRTAISASAAEECNRNLSVATDTNSSTTVNTIASSPDIVTKNSRIKSSTNEGAYDHDNSNISITRDNSNDSNVLEMLALSENRLINLYKCNEANNCLFSTSSSDEFCRHLRSEHLLKKSGRIDSKFLKCLYCISTPTRIRTPQSLVSHLDKTHRFCQYLCPYCVFRACRPIYILWHLNHKHGGEVKKILTSSSKDNLEDVMRYCSSQKKYSNVVQSFRCTHGCAYETYSLEAFASHLRGLHSGVPMTKCYHDECRDVPLKREELIKHYELHNMAEFQCVYCVTGCANINLMKSHLMMHHPSLYPKAVRRRNVPLSSVTVADPWVKFVCSLDLDKSLESLAQYVKIVTGNEFSKITLYRDESEEGDASVNSAVVSVTEHVVDNLISFTNQLRLPDHHSAAKSAVDEEIENAVAAITMPNNSEPFNSVGKGKRCSRRSSGSVAPVSTNSSDDEQENRLVICESESENDQNVSWHRLRKTNDTLIDEKIVETSKYSGGKQTTRSTCPAQQTSYSVIGLQSKDLYRCGMTDCAVAVEDYHLFKEHLSTCDNARKTKKIKCRHCNREFSTNIRFLSHIHSHGLPRFHCTLCDFKCTTRKKVNDHFKTTHKVLSLYVMPADPFRTDQYKDDYLVLPDASCEKSSRKPRLPKNVSPSTNANDVLTKVAAATTPITGLASSSSQVSLMPLTSTEAGQSATVVCSWDDVEKFLPQHLHCLPKAVHCGICNTYSTKIRKNIEYHMKEHAAGGLTANRDIINPVPRIGKTDGELMFNKMANHAAYSVRNDDKSMKAKDEQLDEYDRKAQKAPAVVARRIRFTCSVSKCRFVCHDGGTLTNHVEKLHPELNQFTCPHCGLAFKVSKINIHLRYHSYKLYKCCCCDFVHYQKPTVEKHQEETHNAFGPSITIRELGPEDVEKLEAETRHIFDVSPKPNVNSAENASVSPKFKCNLCGDASTPTEYQMKNHCRQYHNGSDHRYKCCWCNFARDNKDEINAHLQHCHASVSQVFVRVYREINEEIETACPASIGARPKTSVVETAASADWKKATLMAGELRDASLRKSNSVTDTERSDLSGLGSAVFGIKGLRAADASSSFTAAAVAGEESNVKCVAPFPDGSFKCPFCPHFKSDSMEQMREHIFKEKNYLIFVCRLCGTTGVAQHELESHILADKRTHPGDVHEYLRTLTRNPHLESKVDQALEYQRCIIEQYRTTILQPAQQPPLTTVLSLHETVELSEPILIQDSSDDEETSPPSTRRPVSTEPSAAPVVMNSSNLQLSDLVQSNTNRGSQRSSAIVKLNSSPSPPRRVIKREKSDREVGGGGKISHCAICDKVYTSSQALTYHCKTVHATTVAAADTARAATSVTISASESQNCNGNELVLAESVSVISPSNCKWGQLATLATTAAATTEDELQLRHVLHDVRYGCRYCIQTFDTSSLVSVHELTCAKRARRVEIRSETAIDDDGSNGTAAHFNSSTATTLAMNSESAACMKQPSISSCPLLSNNEDITTTNEMLQKQVRCVHERFACLFCEKTFTSKSQLIEHLPRAAELETRRQPNVECLPSSDKDVLILCPLCNFRSPGCTYDNYLRTVDHMKAAHSEAAAALPDECIRVVENGGSERCLISNEIYYLKLKSSILKSTPFVRGSRNASALVPKPAPQKRNVAIKSTARLPMDSNALPPTKIILLTSLDSPSSNSAALHSSCPAADQTTSAEAAATASNGAQVDSSVLSSGSGTNGLEFAEQRIVSLQTSRTRRQTPLSCEIIDLDESPPSSPSGAEQRDEVRDIG